MEDSQNQNISSSVRHSLVIGVFVLLSIIIFGLLWLFFLAPSNPSGLGWYLFSFTAGLSMIVLPCTLPLAFVIVPLSMGKGIVKGLGMALFFSLGVILTLSAYGIVAAIIGGVAVSSLGASLEVVKNWVYFIAGIFALLFALSELGLLNFKMPTYTGAAPAFIQKRQDFLKAFFLGMFLGNIGIGCPHPATPLIFIEIATSGNIFYGWSLFFIHAVGRVLPLLFLAFLGILGVNGLSWLVSRKEKVERATGWAMVFVAGFILTLGLFSHDWWVNSGIHTQFEKITQEHTFLELINENLGTTTAHEHGVALGTGLFGLPLWLGNWVLVFLWLAPLWWWWSRERKEVRDTKFYLILSLLLSLVFIYVLPHNFLEHEAHEDLEPMAMDDAHNAHASLYHEEDEVVNGLVINLRTDASRVAGATSSLEFFVNEKPAGTPVDDLELERGKYIHVIGVRDDLNQFFHIHPEKISSGLWQVEHIFRESGVYKIWSDVTQRGVTHSFGHAVFAVAPGTVSTTSVTSMSFFIGFAKNIVLGDYQVGITYPEPIVAGRDTYIDFAVKDVIGQGVILEPYLGAMAHLAVIKDDLTVYTHTHPTERGEAPDGQEHGHENFLSIPKALANGIPEGTPIIPASRVSFSINFPKAGIYKMFLQFRPEGIELPQDQSLVGEVYVDVVASGPVHSTEPTFSKPVLVFLSLVAMSLLGRAVYKFIQIKK